MLRARPGAFRLTDFQEHGRPNLDWYREYYQYQHTVWADHDRFGAYLLPEGVRNAAGQQIIAANQVRPKNHMKAATEWYLQSDASTPPTFDGAVAYVNEREEQFVQIILEMETIVHSVGHGAIYVVDGVIHVIWGTLLYPEQEPGNPLPRGWFLAEPFYRRPDGDRTGILLEVPNRRWLRYWLDDGATQGAEMNYFYGGIVGGPATDTPIDTRPMDYFAVFGVDEGFYREGLKHNAEVARLDAVMREAATTYGLPVPIINAKLGLVDQGGGLVDLQGNPIQAGPVRALQSVDPDGLPMDFAQASPLLTEMGEEREQWLQRMHNVTNVVREITENRDDQMSGVSRALLARPAVDRIEAAHRQIARALNGAVETITNGAGGLGEVQWARQPFDTLEERRIIAREFFEADLMTRNEAREYIDLEPLPGGDVFRSEMAASLEQEATNADD